MNKIIAIDSRTYPESVDTLKNMGYRVILIPKSSYYEHQICSHADLFITKLKEHVFVDSAIKDLLNFIENKELIDREVPEGVVLEYPHNVSLNCAYFGNKLICNKKYTDKRILQYAEDNNIRIINVKQGYSKCSICIVNENSIITEDDGICKVAQANNIDVLRLNPGFVNLDGYNYGFIGGCSGLIERDLLVFNGDIESHPQFLEIYEFCSEKGVLIKSLCKKPLYDIGSIIRIDR